MLLIYRVLSTGIGCLMLWWAVVMVSSVSCGGLSKFDVALLARQPRRRGLTSQWIGASA